MRARSFVIVMIVNLVLRNVGHNPYRLQRWSHLAELQPHGCARASLEPINWDDIRILAAVLECDTYAAASKALGLDECDPSPVVRDPERAALSIGHSSVLDGRADFGCEQH